jgi:hypothetical protein
MWAVNHQILNLLGSSPSQSQYLSEQVDLQKWFLGFMATKAQPMMKLIQSGMVSVDLLDQIMFFNTWY